MLVNNSTFHSLLSVRCSLILSISAFRIYFDSSGDFFFLFTYFNETIVKISFINIPDMNCLSVKRQVYSF